MADMFTNVKRKIQTHQIKKEKTKFNEQTIKKYFGEYIKNAEEQIQQYKNKYKNEKTSKNVDFLKAITSFEPYYKSTKHLLLATQKNIDTANEKITKTLEKINKSKNLSAKDDEKNNTIQDSLEKINNEIKNLKIEKILKILKEMRQEEKNIANNNKIYVPPAFFENKLNTIKKNITLIANGTTVKNGKDLIKKTINKMNALKKTLDELLKNSHEIIDQEKWNDGKKMFRTIMKEAEEKQKNGKGAEALSEKKTNEKINTKSDISPSFKIGLLHAYYVKIGTIAKACYSKSQELKSDINKYTDSALKKAAKTALKLAPGIIGLAAGITGMFEITALVTISSLAWIICQAGYSTNEAIDAVNNLMEDFENDQNLEGPLKGLKELLK